MSLYDVAVADGHQHERAAILLPVLGSPHVMRFRDAWVEKGDGDPVIAIYTGQGGDTDARWREAIERVQRGEVRPAEVAMMDQLTATLADPSGDGPRVIRI